MRYERNMTVTCEECGATKSFDGQHSQYYPPEATAWAQEHERRCPVALQRLLAQRLEELTRAMIAVADERAIERACR